MANINRRRHVGLDPEMMGIWCWSAIFLLGTWMQFLLGNAGYLCHQESDENAWAYG